MFAPNYIEIHSADGEIWEWLWLSSWSRSSTNQEAGGSIPGSFGPYVFLGKTLNSHSLLMAAPLVCECVYDSVEQVTPKQKKVTDYSSQK